MVTEELAKNIYDTIEAVKAGGKLKIGINEVTKAVEREKAQFVAIAADVSPKEITMHIPILCKEKNTVYAEVPSKKELGAAAGVGVGASAVVVLEAGEAKKQLDDVKKKVEELNK